MKSRARHPAVDVRNLTKYFGAVVAISDLTFEIPAGQAVALLGPTGAGKSTTLRMLTAFTALTSGTVHIDGFNVHEQRLSAMSRLGYLPESGPLYPNMTPMQMLRFFGESRSMERGLLRKRLTHVIEHGGIEGVLDKPIGKLSRLMRLSVGLAQALLHDPGVLVLDEPAAGLDDGELRQFRRRLADMRGGKALLVSTDRLSDLESIVDRVLLMHAGRITFDGTPRLMKDSTSPLQFPTRATSRGAGVSKIGSRIHSRLSVVKKR